MGGNSSKNKKSIDQKKKEEENGDGNGNIVQSLGIPSINESDKMEVEESMERGKEEEQNVEYFNRDTLSHTLSFLLRDCNGNPQIGSEKILVLRSVSKEWRDTIDRIYPYENSDALLKCCTKRRIPKQSLSFLLGIFSDPKRRVKDPFHPTIQLIENCIFGDEKSLEMILAHPYLFNEESNVYPLMEVALVHGKDRVAEVILNYVESRKLKLESNSDLECVLEQKSFHAIKWVVYESKLKDLVSEKEFKNYDNGLDAVYRIMRKPLKKERIKEIISIED